MALTFEAAAELQHTYRPTDKKVIRRLGTITLAPFIAPTAAGKNHTMSYLERNAGYYQVGNLTTRDLRSSDPPNVHHCGEAELLDKMDQGELIQVAVHTRSHTVYGTILESYQEDTINMKDTLSHTVAPLIEYGFRAVRPVCLLVPPDEWESRLDERLASTSLDQRVGRLDEAADSIDWILNGSPDIERVMIINDTVNLVENIERIKTFVEDGACVPPTQLHYDTAEQMLRALPGIRKKFLRKV